MVKLFVVLFYILHYKIHLLCCVFPCFLFLISYCRQAALVHVQSAAWLVGRGKAEGDKKPLHDQRPLVEEGRLSSVRCRLLALS